MEPVRQETDQETVRESIPAEQRQPYSAPRLTEYGDILALTRGTAGARAKPDSGST